MSREHFFPSNALATDFQQILAQHMVCTSTCILSSSMQPGSRFQEWEGRVRTVCEELRFTLGCCRAAENRRGVAWRGVVWRGVPPHHSCSYMQPFQSEGININIQNAYFSLKVKG